MLTLTKLKFWKTFLARRIKEVIKRKMIILLALFKKGEYQKICGITFLIFKVFEKFILLENLSQKGCINEWIIYERST